MKKRILSFALALCFVLTLLPAAFAGSGTASGTRCDAADPKYIASPALRITTVSGRPKITWNSVSGAKLYWVFRSTDGKTFYYLNEAKNTSYIRAISIRMSSQARSIITRCKSGFTTRTASLPRRPRSSSANTQAKPGRKGNKIRAASLNQANRISRTHNNITRHQ